MGIKLVLWMLTKGLAEESGRCYGCYLWEGWPWEATTSVRGHGSAETVWKLLAGGLEGNRPLISL